MASDFTNVLASVGDRLRALRQEHDLTLTAVSRASGISVSTLSRLESGQRRATLELLLPLAEVYEAPLDDLVGSPHGGDPRIHPRPFVSHGMTFYPLSRQTRGVQAYRLVIPGRPATSALPEQRAHEGYEWLYVLEGKLRLLLGDQDMVLGQGEVAEFDTRLPHAFFAATPDPVEVLSLFGEQGERMHVRARTRDPKARAKSEV